MRFTEFLRSTVLVSAASASLLAAVTVIRVAAIGDDSVGVVAVCWWAAGSVIGLWLGRRPDASRQIATLLADARTGRTLPELNPARTLINRLWPLLVMCIVAAVVGIALPQVSAIAAGFAIISALTWRRQSSAVTAIEDRDGARFYIEPTSPLRPIRLTRTPGFRATPNERDLSAEPTASGRPVG